MDVFLNLWVLDRFGGGASSASSAWSWTCRRTSSFLERRRVWASETIAFDDPFALSC